MTEKIEAAKRLAELHYRNEPGLTEVFRLECDAEEEALVTEPIKLLEVNELTVPTGIMPLQFDPHPASGIDYSSVIIEVTPEEFSDIKAGRVKLPNDWKITESLPKPTATPSPNP